MIYLQIFWSFFQIGLFSIGGGYAALPLIEHQVVQIHNWLNLAEFADLITISQMTPGPIALNAATFVGTRVAGLLGSIIATLGCITPSCIIVLTLSYFYFKYRKLETIQNILKGLRPTVVSLIASAGISILGLALFKKEISSIKEMTLININLVSVALVILSVIALRKFKIDPIKVMLASGILGAVIYLNIF